MKLLPIAIGSALLGAVVVVACSDDSPGNADAAVCDCPPAEPPITTTRIHVATDTNTIAPNAGDTALATCADNEILLSGGCEITLDNSAGKMILVQSYPRTRMGATVPQDWYCTWRNDAGSGPADVRAIATCLQPAP
ncbi:MAG: hypothetical protein R3B06_08295 [Kofleriaceae bacterium]